MTRMVRADLAFQRARLVDLFLEFGRRQTIRPIENLVTNGTTGWQPSLGQSKARVSNLIRRHQDLAAIGGDTVRNVLPAKLIDHLRGVAQVQVAVEQRHLLGAAVQHHQCQHPKHAESDSPHCSEPSSAECSQPLQQGLHRRLPLRSMAE